jgi:hypothetical protein
MPDSTLLSIAGQQFMILIGNENCLLFFTRVGEYIAPRLKVCSTCVGLKRPFPNVNTLTIELRNIVDISWSL